MTIITPETEFPKAEGTVGANTSTSRGTTLTAGSPAHTKGEWAQLVASTSEDVAAILVVLNKPSNASGTFLVDIGTGPDQSETVKIANIPFQGTGAGAAAGTAAYLIHLKIPAGTRIVARCQASSASYTVDCLLLLLYKAAAISESEFPKTVETAGANTASSRGTTITAGSANTKGSWVELIASTGDDVKAILVILNKPSTTSATYLVDIGTGTDGNVKVANIPFQGTGAGTAAGTAAYFVYLKIPKGTRVSACCQASSGSATIDCVLLLLQ